MNYIGIDIGGTNLKAGLVDEDGRLLAVKTMKIREVSDPDALTDTLVALTRELAQEGGVPMEEIASVGAGVPGVVDIRTGSIVYTCNLPLRNIPLRKLFKRRLGLHLYVETTPTAPPWRNITPERAGAASALSPSPWAPASAPGSFTTERFSTVATAWPVRWATPASTIRVSPAPAAGEAAGSSTPPPAP